MVNSAVKTRAELERMKLKDVINYADELRQLLVALRKELLDPVDGIVPQLKNQFAVSQQINQYLLKQVGKVERTANSNAQYARKETLEIHGVPEFFGEGQQLEDNVLSLINGLLTHKEPDLPANGDDADRDSVNDEVTVATPAVTANDIHALHRLKKKDRVIVKFISRRKAHEILRKKENLKDRSFLEKHDISGKVFINESMCPAFRHLFWVCKQLKKANKIHYCAVLAFLTTKNCNKKCS